jgi:hypothetical protein
MLRIESSINRPLSGEAPLAHNSWKSLDVTHFAESEDETDGTEDGNDNDTRNEALCDDCSQFPDKNIKPEDASIRNLLSPTKQELVNRLMEEFWAIFNQEWLPTTRTCTNNSSTSSNMTPPTTDTAKGTSSSYGKRKYFGEDNNDGFRDDEDGREPTRPQTQLCAKKCSRNTPRFACLFRKHNPQEYGIDEWRSRALTAFDTIARVKYDLLTLLDLRWHYC